MGGEVLRDPELFQGERGAHAIGLVGALLYVVLVRLLRDGHSHLTLENSKNKYDVTRRNTRKKAIERLKRLDGCVEEMMLISKKLNSIFQTSASIGAWKCDFPRP